MSKTHRIYFFVGTTAELIKVFPVMKELSDRKVPFKVIASGQNDVRTSVLLKLGGVKAVDITLFDGSIPQSPKGLLLWFLRTYRHAKKVLASEFAGGNAKGSIMVVHGDTVSTLMGALLAKKFKLQIGHIEAGLRSYNYLNPFPEEIDRVLVSRYVTTSYCPNDWALNNLKNKGGVKINTGQNTLVDALEIATHQPIESEHTREIAKLKHYFVFVLHRQENLLNSQLTRALVARVLQKAHTIPCVLILHELTKVTLEKYGLLEEILAHPGVHAVPRLPYVDFMRVLSGADFIVTDGGSNQEESYYMGKPCLLLRKKTERIEGLGENALLSMCDMDTIGAFLDDPSKYSRKKITPTEKPSAIIAEHLIATTGS